MEPIDDRSAEERRADEEARSYRELDRAHKARNILEDPLFEGAIEAIKQGIWDDFARSPIDDDSFRLRARLAIDLLDKILKGLKSHMETGKLAQKTLQELDGDSGTASHH